MQNCFITFHHRHNRNNCQTSNLQVCLIFSLSLHAVLAKFCNTRVQPELWDEETKLLLQKMQKLITNKAYETRTVGYSDTMFCCYPAKRCQRQRGMTQRLRGERRTKSQKPRSVVQDFWTRLLYVFCSFSSWETECGLEREPSWSFLPRRKKKKLVAPRRECHNQLQMITSVMSAVWITIR